MFEISSNPSVSVAIASFNGAAFIGEQLASIAAQTSRPTEIVVSDDGSTDETVSLVRKFAAAAPFPVRVLQRDRNVGILENFYAAFSGCRGDVIVYCDQDDVWRRDKISLQLEQIALGAMLVFHPSEIVDAGLISAGRSEPLNSLLGYFRAPVDSTALRGFGHQMAFRRPVLEVMQRLRPIAERFARTDLVHNFDRYIPFCASLIGPISILSEPLTLFRRHAGAETLAGQASRSVSISPGSRAQAIVDRDLAVMNDVCGIISELKGSDIVVASVVTAYEKAVKRKLSRLHAQARVGGGHGRIARGIALPAAVIASLQSTGFSNDTRMRAVMLSLASIFG